jgi:Voltage-dependent anion channel
MATNLGHFTKTNLQILISTLNISTTSSTGISTGTGSSTCTGNCDTVSGTDLSIFTRFHAGYFRISLALCSQALLWKTLAEPTIDARALSAVVRTLPSFAFILLWSLALLTHLLLCILYLVRCLLRFRNVRAELAHHVGMNYLFAPWISFLLLLQSTPFIQPSSQIYRILWFAFSVPIIVLDVKIYGQWFTQGKKFLSMVANPTSQITVIGIEYHPYYLFITVLLYIFTLVLKHL